MTVMEIDKEGFEGETEEGKERGNLSTVSFVKP